MPTSSATGAVRWKLAYLQYQHCSFSMGSQPSRGEKAGQYYLGHTLPPVLGTGSLLLSSRCASTGIPSPAKKVRPA